MLEDYDGTRWSAANDADPTRLDDRYLRISSTIDNPASGRAISLGVSPSAVWALPWVPTAGAVQSLSFGEGDRIEEKESFRYNPASGGGVMTRLLAPGDVYAFSSVASENRLRPTMSPSAYLDQDLYAAGAFLDPVVQAWSSGATSPMDALFRVARRLKREGRYSDGTAPGEERYGAGHSERRLGPRFVLSDPSVGNDEQYAATMALVANRLGIPARVVVGAVLRRTGVIEGRHVEAWVEVRIDDGSWRTLPTRRFMSQRPPPRLSGQEKRQIRTFPELEEPAPEPPPDPTPPPEQEPRSAEDDGTPWLLLLLTAVLLSPSTVPALKLLRRRRRLGADRTSTRFAGAWLELVDHARDLGTTVPAGVTRPAQARALGVRPDLAAEADDRIFAAHEPRPSEAAAYWDRVRGEMAGLAAGVPVWRRVLGWLDPRSLR